MSDYSVKEERCFGQFVRLGPVHHLWTPENFEIIFRNDEDFRRGMGIIAIAAKLYPDVIVITFELMTNHLHIMAAGKLSRLLKMFESIRRMLARMVKDTGRTIDWSSFKPGTRTLASLDDARNVLVYDNRNGFLVHPDQTPFSYPWGANSCYFNPDSKKRYLESARSSTCRERRSISRSHLSDDMQGIIIIDDYVSPFCFCDINAGEGLFRDATHYFHSLSKNIEHNNAIAKEIGESISYTEDELYSAISLRSKKEFGTRNMAQLSSDDKIKLAKVMYYDFNANPKQIQRFLHIDKSILVSLGLK